MSIFSSQNAARIGSLGVSAFIPCPPLPTIIAEWAAILPLVTHLASQRDDYITTGEVALRGRLSIGLFPRLGILSGYARLLSRGNRFLDHAGTKGGSSRTVWDVQWGSVFPCANGSAISAVTKYLLARSTRPLQQMPEKLSENSMETPSAMTGTENKCLGPPESTKEECGSRSDAPPRRFQILHVIRLSRSQTGCAQPLSRALKRVRGSKWYQVIVWVLQIGISCLLCLIGAYGTSAVTLCCTISEVVARRITIFRPLGYLINNEEHDACMLVAPHANAMEWTLFIGDRGIVDALLNKAMFEVPQNSRARLAARWFWFAHLLQLVAMTFVAAQKAWDGVCMVILLGLHWAYSWSFCGQTLAQDWLRHEKISADVWGFTFRGRTAMLGAIQVFSGTKITRWMDDILVPHPRREAWLRSIQGDNTRADLGPHDIGFVTAMTEASFAGGEVLKRECDFSGDIA